MKLRTYLFGTLSNGDVNEYYLRNLVYENIESIVSIIHCLRFIALGALDHELDDYLSTQANKATEDKQYSPVNPLTEFGEQNLNLGPDLDQYCFEAINDYKSYCFQSIYNWDYNLMIYVEQNDPFLTDDFDDPESDQSNLTIKSRYIDHPIQGTKVISLMADRACIFRSSYIDDDLSDN
jgi:hypothetical protein